MATIAAVVAPVDRLTVTIAGRSCGVRPTAIAPRLTVAQNVTIHSGQFAASALPP